MLFLRYISSSRSSLPTFARMKAILLLSMFSVCLSAKAQFHTVAKHQPVCRIDTKKDLPKAEKVSNPNKESVATAGKFPVYEHSEWIWRYMSVSYPLKHVIVTSPYGLRTDPFSKKRSRHNGIDLRAKGEEAYAMLSGVVGRVGQDKRFGQVRHPPSRRLYRQLLPPFPSIGSARDFRHARRGDCHYRQHRAQYRPSPTPHLQI